LGAAQVPYFFLPGAAQVLALFLEYNDVDASFFGFSFCARMSNGTSPAPKPQSEVMPGTCAAPCTF